jgi:hypothetical protein
MAYSQGSLILDDDYNIFATGNAAGTGDNDVANINTVWGVGTGDKGYGQTTTVDAVSAGSTITATQWATLLTRMTSIANHQDTSITAISNPNAGDTIEAYAALSANITSIFNNRNNAAANGSDITTNGTTQTSSTWDVRAVTTKTVTFGSADELRYFFNAGGMIRMSFSLTGGSDAKSQEWADLLTKTGTIVVTGAAASKTIAAVAYTGTTKVGGSGTPTTLATGTGAYDYTGSPVEIFKQFADSAPYTANYIEIDASISGDVISFVVTLEDAAADTVAPDGSGSGDALDVVDGTLTMTTVVRPPSTTHITNTWGTPTMNAASWTLTSN